jgi:hypothetical protein
MYSRVCRGTREVPTRRPAARPVPSTRRFSDNSYSSRHKTTRSWRVFTLPLPPSPSSSPSPCLPPRSRAQSAPWPRTSWRLGTQPIFKLVTTHTHFALLIKKANGASHDHQHHPLLLVASHYGGVAPENNPPVRKLVPRWVVFSDGDGASVSILWRTYFRSANALAVFFFSG